MLSAQELASMRAEHVRAMPDTCTVERPTLTPDGQGGHLRSWGTVLLGVPCSLGLPKRSPLEVRAARLERQEEWVATLPHGTDVRSDDRLLLGSTGRRYRVVAVEPEETYDTAVRAAVVPEP